MPARGFEGIRDRRAPVRRVCRKTGIVIGVDVPWLRIIVKDLQAFHSEMTAKGVSFPMAPKKQEYGSLPAQFRDSEGASVSVSASRQKA